MTWMQKISNFNGIAYQGPFESDANDFFSYEFLQTLLGLTRFNTRGSTNEELFEFIIHFPGNL